VKDIIVRIMKTVSSDPIKSFANRKRLTGTVLRDLVDYYDSAKVRLSDTSLP
jgi:hypothetical protein